MKKAAFIIAMLSCILCFGQANQLDSSELAEAVIHAHHKEWSRGASASMDSNILLNYRGGSLSQMLSMAQPLHIKSYGVSGLATIAYRGLDPTSLNLIWNGVKLNSSFNASVDFSTIPSFFFDGADFYSNTSASFSQGGAVGADMILESRPGTDSSAKYEILTGLGSFGYTALGLKFSRKFKLLKVKTQFFTHRAKNDFPFSTLSVPQESLRTKNAATQSIGFMSEQTLPVATGELNTAIWYQHNYRELPATQLEANSVKNQIDDQWVLALNWSKTWDSKQVKIYNSYVDHKQNYVDSNSSINSHLERIVIQNTAELKSILGKRMLLYSQVSSYFSRANTDNYSGEKQQWYGSQNTALRFTENQWKYNAGIRSVLDARNQDLLMPHISVRYRTKQNSEYFISLENSSRIPTLNELFWQPGGDSSLVPMRSWKYETGANWKAKSWNVEQVFYYTNVENYIQWLPVDALFSPVQINQVTALGSETQFRVDKRISDFRLVGNGSVNLNRSVEGRNVGESVEQRIFMPYLIASGSLFIHYKKTVLGYVHSFTSSRKLSKGGNEWLDEYYPADLSVSHRLSWATATFRIRNIWAQEYMVLPYRPMPGRSFEFNINFTISTKTNETN